VCTALTSLSTDTMTLQHKIGEPKAEALELESSKFNALQAATVPEEAVLIDNEKTEVHVPANAISGSTRKTIEVIQKRMSSLFAFS
jgi:hypothetical protein